MENQMKICFITREQYNILWDKSQPQHRFTADLPTQALLSKNLNTLFIVGKQEDFLATPEEGLPKKWFPEIG